MALVQNSYYHSIHSTLFEYANYLYEPAAYSAESFVRVISPLKEGNGFQPTIVKEVAYRVFLVASLVITIPVGLVTATVGCAVHAIGMLLQGRPYSVYKSVAPIKQHDTLSIAQLNICGLYLSRVFGGVINPHKRIDAIAQEILQKDADVICLSEVHLPLLSKRLIVQLKEKYPYFLYNILPSCTRVGSGLFVASRYPIKDIKVSSFTDRAGLSSCINKGYVAFSVFNTTTQEVFARIVSTHLQPGTSEAERSARKANFQQIREEVFQTHDFKKTPLILAGDLNLESGEYSQILQRDFFNPIWWDEVHTSTNELIQKVWNPDLEVWNKSFDYTLLYYPGLKEEEQPSYLQGKGAEFQQIDTQKRDNLEESLSDHTMQRTTFFLHKKIYD